MFSLKKTSAILCCAAALAVFGAAAFSANAFETVDLNERSSELKADKVNIIADQVYAAPGEMVDFRVSLSGNTGYADCGLQLVYDPNLTVKVGEDGEPEMEPGPANGKLMTEFTLNRDKQIIALGSMGSANCTDDGTLYTVHFQVPDTAKDGDTYPLTINVLHLLDRDTYDVPSAAVNGWIKVRVPVVTTTSAPAPTTTTTVTTTTVPVTQPPAVTTVTTPEPVIVTTPETTPAPPPETTPEPVTVTTPETTEPVTEPITKKTTRDINPNNVATTAQGGTKPAVQGVKTGDVGSGAAAAGLLLAVTAAALVAPKRKDQ